MKSFVTVSLFLFLMIQLSYQTSHTEIKNNQMTIIHNQGIINNNIELLYDQLNLLIGLNGNFTDTEENFGDFEDVSGSSQIIPYIYHISQCFYNRNPLKKNHSIVSNDL